MNKAEIALMQRKVRRKISPEDIQAIAELCAMRLTEREACAHLQIGYDAWNMFKQRNGQGVNFIDVLSRVRTAKVSALVKEIELHGHGDKRRGIRPDWRALDRVLTITDQRYSDRAPVGPAMETDALADSLLDKMLARAYSTNPVETVQSTPPLVDCPPAGQTATVNVNANDNFQTGEGI